MLQLASLDFQWFTLILGQSVQHQMQHDNGIPSITSSTSTSAKWKLMMADATAEQKHSVLRKAISEGRAISLDAGEFNLLLSSIAALQTAVMYNFALTTENQLTGKAKETATQALDSINESLTYSRNLYDVVTTRLMSEQNDKT